MGRRAAVASHSTARGVKRQAQHETAPQEQRSGVVRVQCDGSAPGGYREDFIPSAGSPAHTTTKKGSG